MSRWREISSRSRAPRMIVRKTRAAELNAFSSPAALAAARYFLAYLRSRIRSLSGSCFRGCRFLCLIHFYRKQSVWFPNRNCPARSTSRPILPQAASPCLDHDRAANWEARLRTPTKACFPRRYARSLAQFDCRSLLATCARLRKRLVRRAV
jgi:hypothetical protein